MGDSEDWKPPVECLAKGFVGARARGGDAPVGLPRSFGSAWAGGSMEARKGLVEVGWAWRGSAMGCCEKLCMPFWDMGERLFCALKG